MKKINDLIFKDVEKCGILLDSEKLQTIEKNRLALFVDKNSISKVNFCQIKGPNYKFDWHTHTYKNNGYPSHRDIMHPTLSNNINSTSFVFTNLGIWEITCLFDKKEKVISGDFEEEKIKKLLDFIYFSTKKGKSLGEKIEEIDKSKKRIDRYIKKIVNIFKKANYDISVSFTSWDDIHETYYTKTI